MIQFLTKYSSWFLTTGVVVFILLYLDGCVQHNLDKNRIKALVNYKHQVDQYIAQDGTIVNYNSTVGVTPEDLALVQDTLLNYIANLELKIKNVHSATIITERLRVDSIEVPVYLTACEFDTTVHVLDPHYTMDITMRNTGLTFNSIEFPNRMGVTIAEKREKWWKTKHSIVAVTNSNPHIQVDGISTYTFPTQKKWFNKWWIHATEGVIIGSVATYFITRQ